VVATFALGTAVGDLTADTWGLGNLASGIGFAVLIVLPVAGHRWLGLNAVAAFWISYVLTRPLGASFADWMGSPSSRGGLGIGMAVVAGLWALAIAGVAVHPAVARRRSDRTTVDGVPLPPSPHALDGSWGAAARGVRSSPNSDPAHVEGSPASTSVDHIRTDHLRESD
jgi:hypothetical protein